MMTCKQVARLLSRSLEEALPWHRRLALRLHLLRCAACHRDARRLRFLRAATRRLGLPGELGGRHKGGGAESK